MSLERECAICETRAVPVAKDPYGLPACEACANTFARCSQCNAVTEPHRMNEDGTCRVCRRPPRKHSGIRRHPAAIGHDVLDAEAQAAMDRDKDAA